MPGMNFAGANQEREEKGWIAHGENTYPDGIEI